MRVLSRKHYYTNTPMLLMLLSYKMFTVGYLITGNICLWINEEDSWNNLHAVHLFVHAVPGMCLQ